MMIRAFKKGDTVKIIYKNPGYKCLGVGTVENILPDGKYLVRFNYGIMLTYKEKELEPLKDK